VTYMLFAADKGDINTIIGGIAPDWGPFGALGTEAKTMIQVVMAVAILLCLGIAIWGASLRPTRETSTPSSAGSLRTGAPSGHWGPRRRR